MSENRPFGKAQDIMTPVSTDGMAMAAMIEALRAATRAVEASSLKVDKLYGAVAEVREDIAIMQVREERMQEMAKSIAELTSDVLAIKLLHAQQEGGFKLATMVKDWGPWLMGIFAVLWSIFRKP